MWECVWSCFRVVEAQEQLQTSDIAAQSSCSDSSNAADAASAAARSP